MSKQTITKYMKIRKLDKGNDHKPSLFNKDNRRDSGFSLLELTIAVGVLLLLSAVGLLAHRGVQESAKQSAVNNAADSAYSKALSALTDEQDSTTPGKVEEEYNNSSENVTVEIEELGSGRLQVKAFYKQNPTIAKTLTTPVNSNNGSEENTGGESGDVPSVPVVRDIVNEIVLQCSATTTGRLPVLNIGTDTTIVLVDDNNSRTNISVEEMNADMFYALPIGTPENKYADVYNGTEEVTLEANRTYKLVITGQIEKIIGFQDKRGGRQLDSCIKSIPELGNDSGIQTISKLGSPYDSTKIETIDDELPSSVTSLRAAFMYSRAFKQDLSNWDTTNVTDTSYMFYGGQYNQDLSSFNMQNVVNADYMFCNNNVFNQDLSSWDVSNLKNATAMFSSSWRFDNDGQDLDWRTGSLENTSLMFQNAYDFNQDVSSWDMSKVDNMNAMFKGARKFNQNLNPWDTKSVESMSSVFENAYEFNNGDETLTWDTSSVTYMGGMFKTARVFNQKLNFNTSNVQRMNEMFYGTLVFNQDISHWDTSNVSNMDSMFNGSNFTQDLSSWKVTQIKTPPKLFNAVLGFNGNGGKIPSEHMPQWGV